MKKTGRSLPTKSQLPSSVNILRANPRMSRVVSEDPFSPATVDRRARTLVFLPTLLRKAADVKSDTS